MNIVVTRFITTYYIRRCLLLLVTLLFFSGLCAAEEKNPVLIGIDAEFGLLNSTSAQAIELGARAAVAEINAAGGVLDGRPLKIITRDNRSIPARGIQNLKELVELPDLVAVLGGRFSPVVIQQLPLIHAERIPFVAVWSSADQIMQEMPQPGYIFRVSMQDSLAMPHMLEYCVSKGYKKIGLLIVNNAWGRSNLAAVEKYTKSRRQPKVVSSSWYSNADTSLIARYDSLVDAGAQAIVLVANDEAAILIREMKSVPAHRRVPLISHWGITGGQFFQNAGPELSQIDLSVIQTFSLHSADPAVRNRFIQSASAVAGVSQTENIHSLVGAAHAYDATHMLAIAINQAGNTDRSLIRNQLEKIKSYTGIVKKYVYPFTATRHDALDKKQLMMMKYRADGVLVPR